MKLEYETKGRRLREEIRLNQRSCVGDVARVMRDIVGRYGNPRFVHISMTPEEWDHVRDEVTCESIGRYDVEHHRFMGVPVKIEENHRKFLYGGGRQSGRTSRAMLAAPFGAIYICSSDRSSRTYYQQLAHDLGRDDLQIVSSSWVRERRFVGRQPLPDVVLDHDIFEFSSRDDHEALDYLMDYLRAHGHQQDLLSVSSEPLTLETIQRCKRRLWEATGFGPDQRSWDGGLTWETSRCEMSADRNPSTQLDDVYARHGGTRTPPSKRPTSAAVAKLHPLMQLDEKIGRDMTKGDE